MVNIKIKNAVTVNPGEGPLHEAVVTPEGLKLEEVGSRVPDEKIVASKPEIVIELPDKLESPAALQSYADEVYKVLYMYLQQYYGF